MDSASVLLLLSVWERTIAPLRECRAALALAEWNAETAIFALNSRGREKQSTSNGEVNDSDRAKSLLSKYKERVRDHKDAAPGTLPRCLVWVTERTLARETIMAHWDRHRFFMGAPMLRFFRNKSGTPRDEYLGGYVRLERDLGQAPALSAREEALLAHVDARFMIERFAYFSRRSGMRVAVELSGKTGWVDASGADANVEEACVKLLEIDGVSVAEMTAASLALDRNSVHALLDRFPERRSKVADCGWAALYETALLRTARLLRDVDLIADADVHAARELEEAAAREGVYRCVIARSEYRASGGASFVDVIDRLAIELGFCGIGESWREASRSDALAACRSALGTSLAYGVPIARVGADPIPAFVASFDDDALFFVNGDGTSWDAVLGTTFEKSIAIVDPRAVGFLLVGDED